MIAGLEANKELTHRDARFVLTRRAGAPHLPAMKVLVVGGAGYIGSVCAELLLDEGHDGRHLR